MASFLPVPVYEASSGKETIRMYREIAGRRDVYGSAVLVFSGTTMHGLFCS